MFNSPVATIPIDRMTFTLAKVVCALLVMAHLAGCASARVAGSNDADTTLRAIDVGYRSTPDMVLEGTVKVSGMPVTVWFDGLIRNRDSMKITLTGPFGIAVGAMSATRDSFEFYKADEDIVVIGEPNRKTFERLLMIPLDYDELIALLRGEIPRLPLTGEYEVRAVGDELHYTVRRDAWIETITADPVLVTIRRYERVRMVGDSSVPELAIAYSNFEKFGGRQLARKAIVDVSGGQQRITVTIDEVSSEIPADASFGLEMPDGIERIRFRP